MTKETTFEHPPRGHVALLAYDSANKRWQAVYVDDGGLLQVDAADLTTRIHGWDGAAWQKLPLLWGYSDRYVEDLGGTKDGDGTYSKYSTAVGAGYVYVVQAIFIRNASSDPGYTQIRVYGGGTFIVLIMEDIPIQESLLWSGSGLVLKQGDQVRVYMEGCTNLDIIEAGVWGYKMKVAE